MPTRKLAVALVLLVTAAACEKVTHENIDKWKGTEQGPKKLERALKDAKLDADLRAHAGEALVQIDKLAVVNDTLKAMGDDARSAIVEKLTARLWNDAKFTEQDQKPTAHQVKAKDALFELRVLASGKSKDEIDGYLLDWLTDGGFYEERAVEGNHHGDEIGKTLGERAAPKLIAAARHILDTPPDKDGRVLPFGKNLLAGLANTGSADAVGLLLDLVEHPRKLQDTLAGEAMQAMYVAYCNDPVDHPDEPAVSPHGLLPNAKRFEKLAVDPETPNRNEIHEILAKIPKPDCIPPLAELTGMGDEMPGHLRAVQYGLACGGADAVIPLAMNLPADAFEEGVITKYFVMMIPEAERPKAAGPARALLSDPKATWVAKDVGIEILAVVGGKADAAKVRELAKDKSKLKGWWGKQDDKPKKEQKPDYTLGERAAAVADLLEKKQ